MEGTRATGLMARSDVPVLSLPTYKLTLANGCRPQEEDTGLPLEEEEGGGGEVGPYLAHSVLKSVYKAKTTHT